MTFSKLFCGLQWTTPEPQPEQLPESPHGPVDLPANKSIDNVVLLLLSFYVVGAKTTLVVDQVARAASTRICRQLHLLHGGINMDYHGRATVASSLSARVSRVGLRFWGGSRRSWLTDFLFVRVEGEGGGGIWWRRGRAHVRLIVIINIINLFNINIYSVGLVRREVVDET